MPQHEVEQGDCITSIAHQYGFHWETIWNHADNAALAAKRKDPNVLMPGDIVSIPEKETREETRPTEQLHKFRLFGTPSVLRLRLLKWGKPRANLEYLLHLESALAHGKTSSNGTIEEKIPCGARTGKLTLVEDGVSEEFPLEIGSMDPVDEASGAAARLRNLGFDVPALEENGGLEPEVAGVLRAFQREQALSVTGELDAPTCARLKEIYGA